MNTLILYFSLNGHTKKFAEKLKSVTDLDTIRITPKSNLQYKGVLKYIIGGFQVKTGYEPSIKKIEYNIHDYNKFIFISPVWAGSYAPAINSVLNKYDFTNKEVILISSCKKSPGKSLNDLKQKLPMSKINENYILYENNPKEQKQVVNKILKSLSKKE